MFICDDRPKSRQSRSAMSFNRFLGSEDVPLMRRNGCLWLGRGDTNVAQGMSGFRIRVMGTIEGGGGAVSGELVKGDQ